MSQMNSYIKQIGEFPIALEMLGSDPGADDSDLKW